MDGGVCIPGDRAGVCERPNNGDQIPKDRTQPNDRRARGRFESQGGGTSSALLSHSQILFHCNIYCLCKYLQELERLKAEVESANEFHSQKDSLTLKLQVSYVLRKTPAAEGCSC